MRAKRMSFERFLGWPDQPVHFSCSPHEMGDMTSVDPSWSPDGRFLLFSGADVGTSYPLRAAAADGRPFSLPTLMLARGSRVAFSGDPQTLVILRGSTRALELLDRRSQNRQSANTHRAAAKLCGARLRHLAQRQRDRLRSCLGLSRRCAHRAGILKPGVSSASGRKKLLLSLRGTAHVSLPRR